MVGVRGRIVAIAAVATVLLCVTSSPAAAVGWTSPVSVSPVGDYAQQSQSVASDARGDAIVAWWQDASGEIDYAYRSAGGSFGPPQGISGAQGDTPHVAMNSSGVAVVVWREGPGARGAVITGPQATPQQFDVSSSKENTINPPVMAGIDNAGDVEVFWSDQNGIWYSVKPSGGSFSSPREIVSPSGQVNGFWASVAPNGDAAVSWSDYNSTFAALGNPSTRFSTTELESDVDSSALYYDPTYRVPGLAETAINSAGQAVVSWMQEDQYSYAALASTGQVGQGWSRPQDLGGFDPQTFFVPPAIDPAGNATVVWSGSSDPGQRMAIFSATAPSDGAFQPERDVVTFANGSGLAPCAPAVASDDAGNVYVIWSEWDSAGSGADGCDGGIAHENAAIREAGATSFGPVTTLASAPEEYPPVISAEGANGVIAAWPQATWPEGTWPYDKTFQIEAEDALTAEPGPPENVSPPTVSGTPTQGSTLTAAPGNWTDSPNSYSYRWQDCGSDGSSCTDIPGATTQSYAPQSTDVGSTVRVEVFASNSTGSGAPAFSELTAPVQAASASGSQSSGSSAGSSGSGGSSGSADSGGSTSSTGTGGAGPTGSGELLGSGGSGASAGPEATPSTTSATPAATVSTDATRAEQRTQLTIYEPFAASGKPTVRITRTVRGRCWTGSLASRRSDAWRCMSSNFIYDPCFSSKRSAGIVLCPMAGPWSSAAIEIRLTQSLPSKYGNTGKPSTAGLPWALVTTSGWKCFLATGASTVVDGRRANYACSGTKEWLWGAPIRKSEPWKIYVASVTARKLTRTIGIRAAWF